MSKIIKIAMVADSPSSDLLGAGLIKEMKKLHPNISFFGIGGANMLEQGFNSVYEIKNLSVMGFDDVLLKYFSLANLRKKLIKYFMELKPDVFIGLDAYSFNIKIHKSLKKNRITTIQYACPKIWAWRPNRAKKIKQSIDLVLTLFPFEKEFYSRYNIPAHFVGHPFADEIPIKPIDNTQLRKKYLITPKDKVIAVLPGSRPSDLKYMAPLFIETIKKIHAIDPLIKYIIPFPNKGLKDKFLSLLTFKPDSINMQITTNNSREILTVADLVLVKSGTATLETMLLKKPMIVAYKCGFISHMILKRLISIPYISLPNILLNRPIVDEFVQDKATSENIIIQVFKFLKEPIKNNDFEILHSQLKKDTSKNAALFVFSIIEKFN